MALTREQQSRGMFSYTQMPLKFEHPKQCRHALGLVGGSEVSNIGGSIVDLESDLLGITRAQSRCTGKQYTPSCPLGGPGCPDMPAPFSFADKATGAITTVDTSRRDLPTCQFMTFPGIGAPKPFTVSACASKRF